MPARDVRDELRAIAAERHKRGTPQVKESIGQIAERLTVMFPSVPQETVQAVLSQLFRADAQCSREQLADRAVCALLEMSFGGRIASNSDKLRTRDHDGGRRGF